MLNITFKGQPYLFTGDSLDGSHALTTREDFMAGKASFAHLKDGMVRRYGEVIGSRDDIAILGPAADPTKDMDLADMLAGLDNMLGGDPNWYRAHNRKPRD